VAAVRSTGSLADAEPSLMPQVEERCFDGIGQASLQRNVLTKDKENHSGECKNGSGNHAQTVLSESMLVRLM
jgi:hypothetical protein